MPVFSRVASIAPPNVRFDLSYILYPERVDLTPLRGPILGHLPECLFVLARVVDEWVTLIEDIARQDFADDHGVVARAGPIYELAVQVGQAVEEERRAPRRQAVGNALELVVVLAARVREVGSNVYLILAQDAEGEGLALEGDVVCVAVAPDCDRNARRTFRGLHHPRGRHSVGLAAAPGSHHVDPVGQVTEGRTYRVPVSKVSVQHNPFGTDRSILSGAGILRIMSISQWAAT